MKKAPIPANEEERLAALYSYNILDTEREESFDRITRLAAQICQTPYSTITLIDLNREWFKSSYGVEDNNLPRDISFCGHVIVQNEILVINDALNDDRFHDNPYVLSDPEIHFYAGVPLRTIEGFNLGTLCVFDKVKRDLSKVQEQSLKLLADQVVTQLELHRLINVKNNSILNIKQKLHQQRTINDEKTLQSYRNKEALLTLSNTEFPDQQSAFKEILKVDAETLNINRVSIWLYNHQNTSIICQAIYQDNKFIERPDREIHLKECPVYFSNINESNVLSVNDAIHDPRISELVTDYLIPNEIKSMLDVPIRVAGKTIGIVCHENIGTERNWSEDDEYFASIIAARCALSIEADERKKVELALKKDHRNLFILNNCNEIVFKSKAESELVSSICQIVIESGNYVMAGVGYKVIDEEKSVNVVTFYETGADCMKQINVNWDKNHKRGQGPIGIAICTGKTHITQDINTSPVLDPWKEDALSHGLASCIAIPLIHDSRTYGALIIYSKQINAFDDEEVILLERVASNLAQGIDTLRAKQEREQATIELRASEEKFIKIFHNSPYAVVISKLDDGTIIDMNEKAKILSGYKYIDIAKRELNDSDIFVVSQNREQMIIDLKRYGKINHREVDIHIRTGEIRKLELSVEIVEIDDMECLISVAKDITEQRKAEDQVRLYRHIVSTTNDMLTFVDCNYIYQAVNFSFLKIFNLKNENIIGKHVSEIAGSEVFEKSIKPHLDNCLLGNGSNFEYVLKGNGSRDKYFEVHYVPLSDEDGSIAGIVSSAHDVTDRKKTEAEIRNSRERLRQLVHQLHEVREEERTAISREIHDELGQRLTGLKLDLSWIKSHLPKGLNSLPEKLDASINLTDTTLDYTRNLAFKLRPTLIDDLGLQAAIETEIDNFKLRTGCECRFEIEDFEISNKSLAMTLYRVVQEALTNITRHANATMIEIIIKNTDSDLWMTIYDNGIGIPEDKIMSPNSIGLIGMRERVGEYRGRVNIFNDTRGGTRLELNLPAGNKST